MKLFEYSHSKNDGNVDVYKPANGLKIEILALDPKTGNIEYKEVKEYSVHKNLIMFKFHDPQNRFEDFWVSDDHSLILYSEKSKSYEIASPLDIINGEYDLDTTYLLQYREKYPEFILLFPLSGIEIVHDPEKTIGGDFTVEDYYTFLNAEGIVFQDTASVFLPLTKEAQEEAKEKLLVSKNIKDAADASIGIKLSAEYILGIYYLTQDYPVDSKKVVKDFGHEFPNYEDVKLVWKNNNYDASITVKYNKGLIPIGKLLVITLFKEHSGVVLDNVPALTKKMYGKLSQIVLERNGEDAYIKFLNELVNLAATSMTIYGKSFELKDFILPDNLKKEREKLKEIKDPAKFGEESDKLFDKFIKYLEQEGAWTIDMIMSGAKAKKSQLKQITIAKGVIMDPSGKVTEPIAGSLGEGLTSVEYFKAATGARKGMIDRSQNTAVTGYLTRKMVYASSGIVLDDKVEDCGTTKYLRFNVTSEHLANTLVGRYIEKNGSLLLVGDDIDPKSLVGTVVNLRSPLYCKNPNGICKTCYGELYKEHKSKNIGIIAAQSIGERNTQLTMQTFHTGGAATSGYNKKYISEISIYQPRIIDYLQQKEDKLIAKQSMTLLFENIDETLDEDDVLTTNSYYIIWEDGKKEYIETNSLVSFDVSLYEPGEKPNTLVKSYKKGDVIGVVQPITSDVVDAARYVGRLLERVKGKNLGPEQLLFKLYGIYAKIASLPLVHFEVIISAMSRDPDDLMVPYRLSDFSKPPVLISIKKIPKVDNWLKAAMFEGFKQSLEVGLLSDKPANGDDPLLHINNI